MKITIHQLLARYIRARMRVAHIVQTDLSRRLKISQQCLSGLLCNRSRWSLDILQRIGGMWGMRPEDLIAAARAFRPPRSRPRMPRESERARTTKGIRNEDPS